MKKLLSAAVLIVFVLNVLSVTVFADGDSLSFTIDGFEYVLSHGGLDFEAMGISDADVKISDNASLFLNSYNGSRVVDKALLQKPIPDGLYVYQIINAENLHSSFNLEDDIRNLSKHKDEFISIDEESNLLYVYDSNDPKINVKASKDSNTEYISFADQEPLIVNDRTLLPIRAIAEYYGWNVEWDEANNEVTISNGAKKVVLKIDYYSVTVYVGDKVNYASVDVPPLIINDRTMIPVRAVAEILGLTVDWNQDELCVSLSN